MSRRSFILLLFALIAAPTVYAQSNRQPCAPGISFWKLLESVRIGYGDGRLGIDTLYAVCLP